MFSGTIVWVSTASDAPAVPLPVKHDSSVFQLLQQASMTLDFGAGVKAKQLQAHTVDGTKLDDGSRVGHLGAEPKVRITLKPVPVAAPTVPGVRTPAKPRRARSTTTASEPRSAPRSTRSRRRTTATKEIRGPRVVAQLDDGTCPKSAAQVPASGKVPGRGSGGLTERICDDYEQMALAEQSSPMDVDEEEVPEISRDLWDPPAGVPTPEVETARRLSLPAALPVAQEARVELPTGLLGEIQKGVQLRKTGNLLPSGEHVRVMPMPEPVHSDPKEMEKYHSEQFVRGRLSCRPRRRSCSRPQTPGKAKRARSSSVPRQARTPQSAPRKRRRASGVAPVESSETAKRCRMAIPTLKFSS